MQLTPVIVQHPVELVGDAVVVFPNSRHMRIAQQHCVELEEQVT